MIVIIEIKLLSGFDLWQKESLKLSICVVFLAIHVDEIGKTISRISLFAIWDSIDLVRNENVQKNVEK